MSSPTYETLSTSTTPSKETSVSLQNLDMATIVALGVGIAGAAFLVCIPLIPQEPTKFAREREFVLIAYYRAVPVSLLFENTKAEQEQLGLWERRIIKGDSNRRWIGGRRVWFWVWSMFTFFVSFFLSYNLPLLLFVGRKFAWCVG